MRNIIKYIILFLVIPALLILGLVYDNKKFLVVNMVLIALFACIPFFIDFEKRKPQARELVLVASFTAIVVVSRLAFVLTPGFVPVTALIIIIAYSFGKEMGFMVGALAAVLSNIYYGQGPFTPFQMFAWGIIGYIAGVIFKPTIFNNLIVILIYGALSAIGFSLIMDIQTYFFYRFTLQQNISYLQVITIALPIILIYIISNIFFLFFLFKPVTRILKRIKDKYGLYQ